MDDLRFGGCDLDTCPCPSAKYVREHLEPCESCGKPVTTMSHRDFVERQTDLMEVESVGRHEVMLISHTVDSCRSYRAAQPDDPAEFAGEGIDESLRRLREVLGTGGGTRGGTELEGEAGQERFPEPVRSRAARRRAGRS